MALRAAMVMATLRSLSSPTMIQCVSVSATGQAKFFCLWRTTWMRISFMRVSSAVRQISPSPCTACESPVKMSAPGFHTGMNSVEPSDSSLKSRLPACGPGRNGAGDPGTQRRIVAIRRRQAQRSLERLEGHADVRSERCLHGAQIEVHVFDLSLRIILRQQAGPERARIVEHRAPGEGLQLLVADLEHVSRLGAPSRQSGR